MMTTIMPHFLPPSKKKKTGSFQVMPKVLNWSIIMSTTNTLYRISNSISHSRLHFPRSIHISRACSSISSSCAIVQTTIKGATDQMPWHLSIMILAINHVSRNISRVWKRMSLWIYCRSKRLLSVLRVHSTSWALQTNKLAAQSLKLSKLGKDSIRQISATRATWGMRHDRTRK